MLGERITLDGGETSYSPRDEALLITRQRPKGLKVVSYPKFSIDSENPFLGGQSLRVLGENDVFRLKSSFSWIKKSYPFS